MAEYDLVVIGGGSVGCAAAYHAAGEGKRVLLLEQFQIGHNRGSSHGRSRIIRHSYTSAAYASLAPAAFELWRALERESGQPLLTMTGGIDVGRATNPAMVACRDALTEAGFGSVWLEGAEATAAFPQFNLREGHAILWQSGAGILNADLCVAALADQARSRGASIIEHAAVRSLNSSPSGVAVRYQTDQGEVTVEATSAVVAAGPWAGRFFSALGLPNELRVTHQQVVYYPVENAALWATGRCPIYIVHGRYGFYGFPVSDRPGFIKVAIELETAVEDPDETPRDPDLVALTRLNAINGTTFRGVRPEPADVVTCRYTETIDRDFIIDRHPDHPSIVLASPCSGHGFKFSILTGKLAAQLATSDKAASAIPNWRPQFALNKSGAHVQALATEWRD